LIIVFLPSIFIILLNVQLYAEIDNANLKGCISYFGISYPFSFYIKHEPKGADLPEAVFERNMRDIENAGIPVFLEEAFQECGISGNDFARLLFIIAFANALEFEEDTIIRSLNQMVRHGKTNPASRALLAAAICQSMGHEGIPVADDRETYYLSVCLCKDKRVDSMATNASFGYEGRVYYLVDLSLRYPIGMMAREPGSSFRIISEGKEASCIDIFSDSVKLPDLPGDSSADGKIDFFLNYKNVNYDISLHLNAHLRQYVSNLPLCLPLFFDFAAEEIAATGCVRNVQQYLEEFKSEVDKVNFLLAIAQDSALCIYVEGPLRPTTIVLFDRQADCDTRSQILAGLLTNTGFRRVLVLTTKKHLCLALAPEDERTKIDKGKFIEYKSRKYYFLDPAIINGKWGTAMESGQWKIIMDLEGSDGDR
jgi:hypothetical protein